MMEGLESRRSSPEELSKYEAPVYEEQDLSAFQTEELKSAFKLAFRRNTKAYNPFAESEDVLDKIKSTNICR